MFGNNPIRPPVKGEGNQLDIQQIFATFQGEGPFVGWPAIFIRLGGCNLACSFCDTEFESYHTMLLADILAEVERLAQNDAGKRTHPLVVITGGEPLRQPIERLCSSLLERGFTVQMETNGTLYRALDERVHIICSPKSSNGKYYPIREDLLSSIMAFKFIISAHQDAYSTVAEVGQTAYNIPVYVQPMDEYDVAKNAHNMQKTVALAQENGYRFSLQTHKIAGVE